LFDYHPRRQQFIFLNTGYYTFEQAAAFRAHFGLCPLHERPPNPKQIAPTPITFFPPDAEKSLIEQVAAEPFVLLSASSGESSRNIPPDILQTILEMLAAQNIRVAAVGRNYDRFGRFEQATPDLPNIVNLIDKLTVPSVAVLVQRCLGTINGHSAINMLGWLEKKPQLLLLNEGAWLRHFRAKDLWSHGTDYNATTWVRFEQFKPCHLQRFLFFALQGIK
jgi:ADP-heptose:LPS heptosyltransferase